MADDRAFAEALRARTPSLRDPETPLAAWRGLDISPTKHIPTAVVHGLRARGIDASTAGEVGQLGASDATLLALASAHHRVLITADADHLRLHAAEVPHAGILFAPHDAVIGLLIGGAMRH